MGKATIDAVLDAALQYVVDYGDTITVCTTDQPTSYAEATESTDYMLATTSLTTADFTIADATGGGRKFTIGQQASITVAGSGTAGHVAVCNSTGSALLFVTTCTTQSLTTGNTVTVPAFAFTIGDPT